MIFLDSFHADDPPPLVDMQQKHWVPLIEWARNTFRIDLATFHSVIFHSQSDETKHKLDHVLAALDSWEMAGMSTVMIGSYYLPHFHIAMERAVYASKSFIIALALVKKRLSVEEAAQAAQVEVTSQIQRWGEVEDCES